MTEQTQLASAHLLEEEVRAAFTERVRAEVALLVADSLAERAALHGADAEARHASRRLREDARTHEREAHRHEQRVALLRQRVHDGRL